MNTHTEYFVADDPVSGHGITKICIKVEPNLDFMNEDLKNQNKTSVNPMKERDSPGISLPHVESISIKHEPFEVISDYSNESANTDEVSNILHTLKPKMETDEPGKPGADDIFIKEEISVGFVKDEKLEHQKTIVSKNQVEEGKDEIGSADITNCLAMSRDASLNAAGKPVLNDIFENKLLNRNISITDKDEKKSINYTLCKKPKLQNNFSKNLTCHICHKYYSKKSQLTIHMRTHTGEKPFTCNICQTSFSQNCNLTVHMRSHTGETPFSCNICLKSFYAKQNFTTHMRTHIGEKPFSCSVCEKSFTQKPHLTIHMRTHTGERPFSCDICQKLFSRKPHLTRHMHTHTGEKPFSCDICQKLFSQKTHLTKHIRRHNGKTPLS